MKIIIEKKLTEAFSPAHLEVINESDHHAGHASSPGTGNSHFRIIMASEAFVGKSRIARHRAVNRVLTEELAGPIHALALELTTPEETNKNPD